MGLTYHTPEGQIYWDESAHYQLNSREVDALEKAANDVQELAVAAGQHIIDHDLFASMGIPAAAVPLIRSSWDRDDFSLYGRMDFSWDGKSPPKLLEYNADTPTALVEAAVAQWFWLQDVSKLSDQFNSIHEHLIAAWKKFGGKSSGPVHLGGLKENLEDAQTVLYIQDTCHQAGLVTKNLFVEDLGFDAAAKAFVDLENETVKNYFKLYPWEWMWGDEFASRLSLESVNFIEPMFKMLWSNKALLPILWQLNPGHPNLLPAFDEHDADGIRSLKESYVRKPKLSREGANISMVNGGKVLAETGGDYGVEGFIYQALAPTADFEGNHPIFGVWMVNHEACGLGIREDRALITGNLSRFVPHYF